MSNLNLYLNNLNNAKTLYETSPTKKNATLYRKELLNLRSELGNARKEVLEVSKEKKTNKATEPVQPATSETVQVEPVEVKERKRRNKKPTPEPVEVVTDAGSIVTDTVPVVKPKRSNLKKKAALLETKTE